MTVRPPGRAPLLLAHLDLTYNSTLLRNVGETAGNIVVTQPRLSFMTVGEPSLLPACWRDRTLDSAVLSLK